MTGEAWRATIAALANDAVRTAYARIVLSEAEPLTGLSPSRARHVREALLSAGLVAERDGSLVADDAALKRMLTTAAVRPTGIDRFFRADGRIDRYPSHAAERVELLEAVSRRILAPDEVVTERVLNERLAAFADDVALLRRHLVDHGVLERTRSGSEYALPAGAPGPSTGRRR